MKSASDDGTSDIWYEVREMVLTVECVLINYALLHSQVMNNDLQRETVQEQPDVTIPLCCLCGVSIPECLVRCNGCADYFCYPGEFNRNNSRSCVVLRDFSAGDGETSMTQCTTNFTCVYCWRHAEQGRYPVSNDASNTYISFYSSQTTLFGDSKVLHAPSPATYSSAA
jgi:hypothetical protein